MGERCSFDLRTHRSLFPIVKNAGSKPNASAQVHGCLLSANPNGPLPGALRERNNRRGKRRRCNQLLYECRTSLGDQDVFELKQKQAYSTAALARLAADR